MDVTRAAGKLGIPGLYVTGDPGAADDAAKVGSLAIRIGLGWAKSLSFTTGQCPVMRYHRGLMQMILHDKAHIAKAVNATVISLDEASQGYKDFDSGVARKVRAQPAWVDQELVGPPEVPRGTIRCVPRRAAVPSRPGYASAALSASRSAAPKTTRLRVAT
jgi:hypothetical protein